MKVEKNYNTTEEIWHNVANEENVWIKWRFDTIKLNMKKAGIDFKKNYLCLDVGCGKGNFAHSLENISDFTVDQIDVDAKNLLNKNRGKGSVFEYDINKKDKKLENKYDIIFLLDVLEHIKDENEFIKSCYFHLKKDGFLIINVPSLPILFSKYDVAVGHLRRYNKNKLKYLLMENQFKIFLIKHWGFLLIPILFLRTLILNFSKKSNTDLIKSGMDTQPKIILVIFNILKFIELKIIKYCFLGTSVISIVKK